MLGSQLRDLRTVIAWLKTRPGIEGKKIAVWGDSFAEVNSADAKLAVPLDLGGPVVSEPGGAQLALLAGLFEEVAAVYAGGGLTADRSIASGPNLYLPHDAIIPAPVQVAESVLPLLTASRIPVQSCNAVDAQNRAVGKRIGGSAVWVIAALREK